MELVIDRKRWGTGIEGGELLDEVNKMCCLGFFCRQAGFGPKEIINQAFPDQVVELDRGNRPENKRSERLMCLLNKHGENSRITMNLASVNDSTSWRYDTLPKKEKRIIQLFKKVGVSVKFIN